MSRRAEPSGRARSITPLARMVVALLAVVVAGPGLVVASAAPPTAPSAPAASPASPSVGHGTLTEPAPVLRPDSPSAPIPRAGRVQAAVASALADPRLGGGARGSVVDVLTGRTLLDRDGESTATPASTAKVLTAVAALSALGPDFRFTTTVVAGSAPGEIVLVGGGDPTLTAAPPGTPPSYAGAPRVSDLAAAVRHSGGTDVSTVVVDGARFTGPRLAPGWDGDVVAGGDVAPVTAATVDGGRNEPGLRARSDVPDLLAGRTLAAALDAPDAQVVRGQAPAGAKVLGSVHSPPLSGMLARMLTASDNALAEYIARQVAIAERRPASFAGAGEAVREVILGLGGEALDPAQLTLADGSGLSRDDAISPAVLTTVLRVAATKPALRSTLGALPVAGYTGTLATRFRQPPAAAAAGLIRAKTGTLSGVSSLAGVVQDADGRLLAFAFMVDHGGGTLDAEAALDVAAARLAGCGCR